MKGKLVLVLSLFVLLSFLVHIVRFCPVEVEAVNGYPVHNLDTGFNYTTIQEAIDANETLDGHTIFAEEGTYLARIMVDKSIEIVGEDTSKTSIVGRFDVVNLIAGDVTISGFTVEMDMSFYEGSCIRVHSGSENNVIRNNTLRCVGSLQDAVYLEDTFNNTVTGNSIESPDRTISLRNASDNRIVQNTIDGRGYIVVSESSDNYFEGNKISGGIAFTDSPNNTFRNNVINSSETGLRFFGDHIDYFFQDIDPSNTLNGKPIYYWVSESDRQVPEDAGFVALVSSTNITAKNLTMQRSSLILVNTNHSKLENSEVSSEATCVQLLKSNHNTIRNFTISSPEQQGYSGISMKASNYNRIINSQIVNMSHAAWGIQLSNSSHNHICANTISDVQYGITIRTSSDNNTISQNTISHNRDALYIFESSKNRIHHNNFIDNWGKITCINSTNSWNKPYPSGGNYWSNYNGTDLPIREPGIKPGDWIEYELNWTLTPPAPYSVWTRREILYVNGSIITVEILQEMSDGSFQNSTRTGDIVEGTGAAAAIFIPPNLQPGDLVSIEGFGVVLINGTDQRTYLGTERTVLWSHFLEKDFDILIYWDRETGVALEIHSQHVSRQGITTIKDTNMWNSGRDGIGDNPYIIDANNTDNYPLMGMFSDFNATLEQHVQTICNSTISDFQLNETAISFNVTGEEDTIGFCRILIPTALMNETYKVYVNGTEVSYDLLPFSNDTHSYLYFTYNHSTQEVVIIPEFPSILVLPLFLITTLLAVIFCRRVVVPRKVFKLI